MVIDAHLEGLGSPSAFGPEYITYALWAITPDGRPQNLGEILPQGKSSLTVTSGLPASAAAYGWGLLRNHPFVDGNKRIALAAMVVFLDLNGWELKCTQAEETAMILRAAAGEISERAWSEWVGRGARRKA